MKRKIATKIKGRMIKRIYPGKFASNDQISQYSVWIFKPLDTNLRNKEFKMILRNKQPPETNMTMELEYTENAPNPKYPGKSYNIETWAYVNNYSNMIKFLTEIPSVGIRTAQALYEKFGSKLSKLLTDLSEQLSNHPENGDETCRKLVIKGQITLQKAHVILTGWQNQKGASAYVDLGLSPKQAICIRQHNYKMEMLKRNPWHLMKFNSKGKRKLFNLADCDRLGEKFKIPKNNVDRLDAWSAELYTKDCNEVSHMFLRLRDFVERNCAAIGHVSKAELLQRLRNSPEFRIHAVRIKRGCAIMEEERIYSIKHWKIESKITNFLSTFVNPLQNIENRNFLDQSKSILNACTHDELQKLCNYVDDLEPLLEDNMMDNLLGHYSEKSDVKLTPQQVLAVKNVFKHPISIITGGPGTGKTTITRAIMNLFGHIEGSQKERTYICSFTGKAVSRLRQVLKDPKDQIDPEHIRTIHSLIHAQWPQTTILGTILQSPTILLIDEVSMLSASLMAQLLKTFGNLKRIVFIGDPNQLPSIGSGLLLKDLINSRCFPCVKLQTIFRQSTRSGIITNCRNIIESTSNLDTEQFSDTTFYDVLQPTKDFKLFCKEFSARADYFGWIEERLKAELQASSFEKMNDNVMILTPRNSDRIEMNYKFRKYFNPNQKMCVFESPGRTKKTFYIGDRVIALKNNSEKGIYNGLIGFIVKMDYSGEDEHNLHESKKFVDTAKRRKSENSGKETRKPNTIFVKFENKLSEVSFREQEIFDYLEPCFAMTIHKSQGSEYKIVLIYMPNSMFKIMTKSLIYTGISRARNECCIYGNKNNVGFAIKNIRESHRNTGLRDKLRNKMWF